MEGQEVDMEAQERGDIMSKFVSFRNAETDKMMTMNADYIMAITEDPGNSEHTRLYFSIENMIYSTVKMDYANVTRVIAKATTNS